MRIGAAIMLLGALTACDNRETRWAADCAASRQLYHAALAAMCTPWSEKREAALVFLVEASQDNRFEDPVSGEIIGDYVDDISPADCINAGYENPGAKEVDPKAQRIRDTIKKMPPPPGFTPESLKVTREAGKNERMCDLASKA